MTFQIFITGPTSRFSASGLNGKLAIYPVLAYLVELTLLAVIEVRTDTKRNVSIHCVPALTLPYKSIELVEERFDPCIGAILLLLHHCCVKRAPGTTLVSESTHTFFDDLGLEPDAGRDDLFLDRWYFYGHRHL